jgi:hypothetical protein
LYQKAAMSTSSLLTRVLPIRNTKIAIKVADILQISICTGNIIAAANIDTFDGCSMENPNGF